LTDTLEGISGLPEAIEAVVRSSLDDGALIEALKVRLEDLEIRLERLKDRYAKKRLPGAMGHAGSRPRKAYGCGLLGGPAQGHRKARGAGGGIGPKDYFVPQPAKLDRRALLEVLKSGRAVSGAALVMGEASIQGTGAVMVFSSGAASKKLTNKLDRQYVHTRSVDGKDIDYIEGGLRFTEANAIFGFGGWDREMVPL